MSDLFTLTNNSPYENIYAALSDLRELFHREGRMNDSNSKLDEIVKLIAVQLAIQQNLIKYDNSAIYSKDGFISIALLQQLFQEVATLDCFKRINGNSIFGLEPTLELYPGDEVIATRLFKLSQIAFNQQYDCRQNEIPFDILNEAFGHFVRDTFRNNLEDAQYMTPPEVVEFMVELAIHDIAKELGTQQDKHVNSFFVMDPSCGVGSFLTAFRRAFEHKLKRNNTLNLQAIGQDKVDRMVRLSFMNMMLYRNSRDIVTVGNSLVDESNITQYNGKIDLILTNPPFGAKFQRDFIATNSQQSLPIFSQSKMNTQLFDSEILFIDRYLSLLREGGKCLVVVPDAIVSAKGIASFLRQHISKQTEIRAIIELPSVTFAQAGTRTRTVIIYFQKRMSSHKREQIVFFAETDSIGFEVSMRKGVPIKKYVGTNQLPRILKAYKGGLNIHKRNSCSERLFAKWKTLDLAKLDAWTPRQFQLDDYKVARNQISRDIELVRLEDLVEREPRKRKSVKHSHELYISVLHIIGEGILDIASLNDYRPITPGIPVNPSEILLSRINPRIPRILVVPDLDSSMLCSSEFEILNPKKGLNPYLVAYLLRTEYVQQQISALTAGTSSSHSRVKSEKLYAILIPFPKHGSAAFSDLADIVSEYEESLKKINAGILTVTECRAKEKNVSLQFVLR